MEIERIVYLSCVFYLPTHDYIEPNLRQENETRIGHYLRDC